MKSESRTISIWNNATCDPAELAKNCMERITHDYAKGLTVEAARHVVTGEPVEFRVTVVVEKIVVEEIGGAPCHTLQL